MGIAPYKGGGADFWIGVRKYCDSNDLKGRVIVTFVFNGGSHSEVWWLQIAGRERELICPAIPPLFVLLPTQDNK